MSELQVVTVGVRATVPKRNIDSVHALGVTTKAAQKEVQLGAAREGEAAPAICWKERLPWWWQLIAQVDSARRDHAGKEAVGPGIG